ncbi:MAG: hypothetical protein ACYDBY_01105 [Thermoanaerobaculia bacterium]
MSGPARLFRAGVYAAAALIGLPAALARGATVTIVNADAAGVGFNDPTAAAPIGGNTGTTLGQQRLIAFQHAADLWGSRLTSAVSIVVRANFGPLAPCTPTSGVIGSAGPANAWTLGASFPNVPAGTIVTSALASKLLGSDVEDGVQDINASFNSSVGTAGCLSSSSWYLGLDGNASGSQLDFVTVLLHELGHGLGFLTFVNVSTGALAADLNDVFQLNLRDNTANLAWSAMTNAQRQASAINTNGLVWSGAQAVATATTAVATGKDASNRPMMFAPNPVQVGSSVSHWNQSTTGGANCATCTNLSPNDLMKPSYTGPLHATLITHKALEDTGWGVVTTPVEVESFTIE